MNDTVDPVLDAAAAAAAAAAPELRRTSARDRAAWLEAIAEALETDADSLVELADEETSLGAQRLQGEIARTTGQLRLFGEMIQEGSYLEAIIDHARPEETPPAPDLRRMLVPIGPVAVFTASNFPFAFSVVGGDTASALAAGCPVIVKGHSAHPRLSLRTAALAMEALRAAGAPAGAIGHVTGRATGAALVRHPVISAVGFTGSLTGGRALFDLASGRDDPIPFYGELSALNPVVITADALTAEREGIVSGLAASFQLGHGQFCTKPGVVLAPVGTGLAEQLAEHLREPAPMLSPSISQSFLESASQLSAQPGMRSYGDPRATGLPGPVVFSTTAQRVLEDPAGHLEECFGPATLIVEYHRLEEAAAVLQAVGGSLTASLHAAPGEAVGTLVEQLERIAGRVVFGGWPTGVSVGWAQNHGGPWPATTAPHTSVGTTAIRRFLRPLAWQSAPPELLPPELQDENPLNIPRRVDGMLQAGRSNR